MNPCFNLFVRGHEVHSISTHTTYHRSMKTDKTTFYKALEPA